MEAGREQLIDWQAPWFAPLRERGDRVLAKHAAGVTLHDALNGESPGVRFVEQDALEENTAYESHIFATGTVPTRENLHDFFNGLVWLAFPRSKKRLNELQASAIDESQGKARGPLRDAITVFDENGAFLHASDALWDALLARDWHRAFIDLRADWARARITLFGHALLEKLVTPRKEITAHVWRANAPVEDALQSTLQRTVQSTSASDEWLQAQLQPQRLATKPFTPLPLSGIPGWHPQNSDFSFYDDRLVFRPAGQQNDPITVRPGTLSRT